MIYFLALFTAAISPLAFVWWRRAQRRARLLRTPLSPEARRIVARAVPLSQRLPDGLMCALEGRIQLFLDQVAFIGCDGLDVTEEMRLSIAAQAGLLVMGNDAWYEKLRTVLIYPGAFRSRTQSHSGYVVTEENTVRLGESWGHGRVVLSWADAEAGARDEGDGHNVVFHEFAHQLDDLSGSTNGLPLLSRGQSYADWAKAMEEGYEAHLSALERGQRTLIDRYGGTGIEEYFAVVVELFFERPAALKAEEPALYAELVKLFSLDPADWPGSAAF